MIYTSCSNLYYVRNSYDVVFPIPENFNPANLRALNISDV